MGGACTSYKAHERRGTEEQSWLTPPKTAGDRRHRAASGVRERGGCSHEDDDEQRSNEPVWRQRVEKHPNDGTQEQHRLEHNHGVEINQRAKGSRMPPAEVQQIVGHGSTEDRRLGERDGPAWRKLTHEDEKRDENAAPTNASGCGE